LPVLRPVWPLVLLIVVLNLGLGLAYQVRPDYTFNLSRPELDPTTTGFYGVEHNESFAYRWTLPEWQLSLPLAGRQKYRMEIEALSLSGQPVQVTTATGQEVGRFSPDAELKTYSLTIPASQVPGNRFDLKFSTPPFAVPGDNRKLGILVTKLRLQGQGEGIILPPVLAVLALMGAILPLYLIPAGFLGLNGKLFGRAPLAGTVLVIGLADCYLAATNRNLFAQISKPAANYLGIATALQYLFLLAPPLLEMGLARFQFYQTLLKVPLPAKPQEAVIPQKWLITWGTGAVAVYLLLRLPNLLTLPIFLDEALHIAAGQGAQTGDFWVVGFTGKALQGWLLAFFYSRTGLENLLLVARLLSVGGGLVTLAGCYLVGAKLYSPKAGLIAAWLWAVLPLAVWNDRMALVDTLMTAFTALVLVFSLRLFEANRARVIFGYGVLVGLALTCAELTKLTGLLAVLTPFALGLIFPVGHWLRLARRLSVVAPVFYLTTVPTLNLDPQKNWGMESHGERFAGFDIIALLQNLQTVLGWYYAYLTAPLLVLLLLLPVWIIVKDRRRGIALLLMGVLPVLAIVTVSRVLYSRYFLFVLVSLIILLAGMLSYLDLKINRRNLVLALTAVALLPALWLNWQMITVPAEAPLPENDQIQYVKDWPSGYGLAEVHDFLLQEANRTGKRVQVLTPNLPIIVNDGLRITLGGDPRVVIDPVYPPPAGLAARLQKAAQGTAYVAVTRRLGDEQRQADEGDLPLLTSLRETVPNLKLTLVYRVAKPGNISWIEIYSLKP
jgi:hypothetical protein